MRKINALVTGVGAIIGYGVINSLKKSKYEVHIVGMDIYEDAVGRFWSDKFIQSIPAIEPGYIDFLRNVMKENQIDIVFFGTEQEIHKVSENRDHLKDLWSRLVINNDSILQLSKDKYKTYEFLIDNRFPAIPSYIDGDYEDLKSKLGSPYLLKPRCSYASKGIHRIYNKEDFQYYGKKAGAEFMVQRIIGDEDHEYTAAVFGFGDGSSLKPIVLRRRLSQEGATVKAILEINQALELEIVRLTNILKPIGPTNYQFRYQKGSFYLLEVNPRISSSTSIRELLGYNESEMAITHFVYGKVPSDPPLKTGQVIRYIGDWVNEI